MEAPEFGGKPEPPLEQALLRLGREVRALRKARSVSRTELSRLTGLSPRFLADLEAGRGNISFLNLRRVAGALGVSASRLVERAEARTARPLALLGMRGAGKTTVGGLLARHLDVPFVELDERVEALAGAPLAQIFELQGEAYYRKLERDALQQFFNRHGPGVVAVGGGLVSEAGTFALLRTHAVTVWLKAPPREHWNRVASQGDRRPMSNRRDAMTELVRLWESRAPLYAQADLTLDTSGRTVNELTRTIAAWLPSAGEDPPERPAT